MTVRLFAFVGLGSFLVTLLIPSGVSLAYPPAVGILSSSRSCLTCHSSNGPWSDETNTIIDVLDKTTGKSLKQPDGSFLIEATRFQPRTVLTLIGRTAEDTAPPPLRNAWLYVDPQQIGSASLSKFAPGWEANLTMACRLVGDPYEPLPGAKVTVLPMTIRPADAARDAELELQVLLTGGESAKGMPVERMISNYLVRRVLLKVVEP